MSDFIDEVVVERALARATRTVQPADAIEGRSPNDAERRVIAARLARMGLGPHAIAKGCRITGRQASQLHKEVTAA